jgi:RimJ/RimL family protein N-acetyltransferase
VPKRTALLPFELETERLLLRPWRPEDVAPLHEIYSEPEVIAQLGPYDLAETEAKVERFVRQWKGEGFSHWAAEDRETGSLIGRIGLMRHHDWPESRSPVEVGWTLHPDYWGRGLATEGGRAAVACWRDFLSDPQLISITRPQNVRSRAVMERLGLTFRGTTFWHDYVQVWYALERDTAG